jgi:hypothetical protein
MGVTTHDEQIAGSIRALLTDAAGQLTRSGARHEALARFEPARRRLLIPRKPVMTPIGRVWRLGVLLLGVVPLDALAAGDDVTLYATGSTTRAIEPGRPGYQSESAEVRRAYRAAAFAGPFERGETVNFDAHPIDLTAEGLRAASGPVVLEAGAAMVRWSPSTPAALTPFDAYLADRVALLAHPPDGA